LRFVAKTQFLYNTIIKFKILFGKIRFKKTNYSSSNAIFNHFDFMQPFDHVKWIFLKIIRFWYKIYDKFFLISQFLVIIHFFHAIRPVDL